MQSLNQILEETSKALPNGDKDILAKIADNSFKLIKSGGKLWLGSGDGPSFKTLLLLFQQQLIETHPDISLKAAQTLLKAENLSYETKLSCFTTLRQIADKNNDPQEVTAGAAQILHTAWHEGYKISDSYTSLLKEKANDAKSLNPEFALKIALHALDNGGNENVRKINPEYYDANSRFLDNKIKESFVDILLSITHENRIAAPDISAKAAENVLRYSGDEDKWKQAKEALLEISELLPETALTSARNSLFRNSNVKAMKVSTGLLKELSKTLGTEKLYKEMEFVLNDYHSSNKTYGDEPEELAKEMFLDLAKEVRYEKPVHAFYLGEESLDSKSKELKEAGCRFMAEISAYILKNPGEPDTGPYSYNSVFETEITPNHSENILRVMKNILSESKNKDTINSCAETLKDILDGTDFYHQKVADLTVKEFWYSYNNDVVEAMSGVLKKISYINPELLSNTDIYKNNSKNGHYDQSMRGPLWDDILRSFEIKTPDSHFNQINKFLKKEPDQKRE